MEFSGDSFEKFRVVVCTPLLFLHALMHGSLKMQSVDLVVFDEVHHLKGHAEFTCMLQAA